MHAVHRSVRARRRDRRHTANSKFTIVLNKAVTVSVKIGWFIVN
jgi:hypothetical protein